MSDADELDAYLDSVFSMLQSPERRYSLTYLRKHDGVASFDDVAAYLSDELGKDTELVKTTLFHTHIPKLQDQGLVAYDQRTEDLYDTTVIGDTKDRLLIDYLTDLMNGDDEYIYEVCKSLSNPDNRHTIHILDTEEEGRSTFSGLAARLQERYDGRPEQLGATLKHRILPALQDSGWVAYDPDTLKVSLTADENDLPLTYLREMYRSDT